MFGKGSAFFSAGLGPKPGPQSGNAQQFSVGVGSGMGINATLRIRDTGGRATLEFDAEGADLYVGREGNPHGGDIIVKDASGNNRIWLSENGGHTILHDGRNRNHAHFGEWQGMSILALGGGGTLPGYLTVRSPKYQDRIVLDGRDGDVKLVGGDCAEQFDVQDVQADAGTVMVIDSDATLRVSERPYDKKVAGVISGAGGMVPGITLDNQVREGRKPLALSGKVFCKVDATYAAIDTGDLLTTFETAGHAMKASDPARAFGAVIGKALRQLDEGVGLIPILVALQ